MNKKTRQETKSTRTQRISKEATVEEICQNLDNVRNIYLVHRYQIENDKYLWPKVLERMERKRYSGWITQKTFLAHQNGSHKILIFLSSSSVCIARLLMIKVDSIFTICQMTTSMTLTTHLQ